LEANVGEWLRTQRVLLRCSGNLGGEFRETIARSHGPALRERTASELVIETVAAEDDGAQAFRWRHTCRDEVVQLGGDQREEMAIPTIGVQARGLPPARGEAQDFLPEEVRAGDDAEAPDVREG
jgi:hypothetical protein